MRPVHLGRALAGARNFVGKVDRTLHTAGKVFRAVAPHVPDSKMKQILNNKP